MSKPKITVAISSYNNRNYIGACLQCVVNQTLEDIEIICIDDCSTDGSLLVLQEYSKSDSRIRLIKKEKNEGLAVLRNNAVRYAKGKYILFLDGDDLYDFDLCRKVYECAELNGSDMVLWDYLCFVDESEILEKTMIKSRLQSVLPDDKLALLQRPAFIWTRLLKLEVFKSLHIEFPKGLTRQDIPVHWQLITQLNKISILPERLCYYRQQPNATTHQKDSRLFDLVRVMDIVAEYLQKSNLYQKYQNEFFRQQFNLLHGMVDSIDSRFREEALNLICQRIEGDQLHYLKSKNHLRWQAKLFYNSILGSRISGLLYHLWLFTRWNYRLLNKGRFF